LHGFRKAEREVESREGVRVAVLREVGGSFEREADCSDMGETVRQEESYALDKHGGKHERMLGRSQ
jgi:hypothetical protein